MTKRFKDLSDREILALAISLEEEDGRIYADFADGLRESYPATAKMFEEMEKEESGHRASLIDQYRRRFGDHIPLIRRQDVRGFLTRRPMWLLRPLGIPAVRKPAEIMELETRQFYEKPAALDLFLGAGLGGEQFLFRAIPPGGNGGAPPRPDRPAACAWTRLKPAGGRDRLADCPAGPRRTDGWLGFHARARLRRRLRHSQRRRCLPRRLGRVHRSRHLHGLRRGAFR